MTKFANELNKIADQNKFVKQYQKWEEAHKRKILLISVKEYWDYFYSDEALYSADEFSKFNGQRDIVSTKWKNNIKTMKCVSPIVGMPFCTQTRVDNQWKMLEKSETALVIENTSKLLDSPAGDSFIIQQIIITLGIKNEDSCCICLRFMNIEFLKFTILKSIITLKSKEGLIEACNKFYQQIEKLGLHKKQPKVIEEQQIIEQNVQLKDSQDYFNQILEKIEIEENLLPKVQIQQDESEDPFQQQQCPFLQIEEQNKEKYFEMEDFGNITLTDARQDVISSTRGTSNLNNNLNITPIVQNWPQIQNPKYIHKNFNCINGNEVRIRKSQYNDQLMTSQIFLTQKKLVFKVSKGFTSQKSDNFQNQQSVQNNNIQELFSTRMSQEGDYDKYSNQGRQTYRIQQNNWQHIFDQKNDNHKRRQTYNYNSLKENNHFQEIQDIQRDLENLQNQSNIDMKVNAPYATMNKKEIRK